MYDRRCIRQKYWEPVIAKILFEVVLNQYTFVRLYDRIYLMSTKYYAIHLLRSKHQHTVLNYQVLRTNVEKCQNDLNEVGGSIKNKIHICWNFWKQFICRAYIWRLDIWIVYIRDRPYLPHREHYKNKYRFKANEIGFLI